jgi:CheY-like chemotaxis protein
MTAPELVPVNRIVESLGELLADLLGADVSLELRLEAAEDLVRIDPTQMEQVLLNLVLNACDAMPNGGQVVISTDDLDIGPAERSVHPAIREGRHTMLTVSDTGQGMDDGTRARVFEPFFTTKSKGSGSGLGLPTARRIITGAGGDITVESQKGRGATFTIHLPLARDEGVPTASAGPGPSPGRGRGETVLVVDDEPEIRTLVSEILGRRGYRVLQAASARQALDVVDEAGGIDLLLADVLMPGGSGPDLAAALARSDDDLRVLFVSGHSDLAPGEYAVRGRATRVLGKPFAADVLEAAVRQALDP